MSYKYRENPVNLPCWETCTACGRCKNKGRYAKCQSCSGRNDPTCAKDPHPDDFCDCRNGILRWITKQGRLIIVKYKSNPYKTDIYKNHQTQDERDYESYLNDMRERLDDPTYDPIEFYKR